MKNRQFIIGRMCIMLTMLFAGALHAQETAGKKPPGVIIGAAPTNTGIYIGSPSICILPDGSYVASHDEFGPKSAYYTNSITRVFRSTDRGETWKQISVVKGALWSTLFCHRGALYMIGSNQEYGDLLIRKSTDNGVTWSVPIDRKTGRLLEGRYHTAPVPVVEHNGRLWRACEDAMNPGGWGERFRSFMMSVPVDADLLDESNWTISNRLGRDAYWFDGKFIGFLEGNAVVTPAGKILNILRTNVTGSYGDATILNVSDDGKTIGFDPKSGFIKFPAGDKKFTIRYDEKSKLYWTIGNIVRPEDMDTPEKGNVRNTQALMCSKDLREWRTRCVILHHPDWHKHGFQYLDWQFDGDDIIAASRTAWDDDFGLPPRAHDANYLTFHRFRNFRDMQPLDSVSGLGKPDTSSVPGVVVAHSFASTGVFVGSPSICILPNGDYVASHDEFGGGREKQPGVNWIYRSSDRGITWKKLTKVEAFWANLFVHNGALYQMGCSSSEGNIFIRRSDDGGETWTMPKDKNSGLLFDDGGYHCSAVPVVVHKGRIWRAFEDVRGPKTAQWGNFFRSFVISASVDADLLKAENWTSTNRVGRDPAWMEGQFNGFLEGNVVVTPDDKLVNILRCDNRGPEENVAIIQISDDGKTASFDPATGFIPFPGGRKKFTIRFDEKSKLYWTLSNYVPPEFKGGNTERTRNTQALSCSRDLRNWEVKCIVLQHPDVAKHGFQYLDWQFEGDDIVAISRTAYDDGWDGADNQHNSNMITFHRFKGFRDLTMQDSVRPAADPAASFESDALSVSGERFSIKTLNENAKAFVNRDYVWQDVPKQLRAAKFTQVGGGVEAVIKVRAIKATQLLVATAASQPGAKLTGWTKTGDTFRYSDRDRTMMSVYTRTLVESEELSLPQGNWTGTLLLIPTQFGSKE